MPEPAGSLAGLNPAGLAACSSHSADEPVDYRDMHGEICITIVAWSHFEPSLDAHDMQQVYSQL